MIYFDNSATTALSDASIAAIKEGIARYGNPSSLHTLGFEAERELEKSREAVAAALGAKSGRIIFTASGTEATNLVFFGSVEAKTRRVANRIIITDSEHPSVSGPAAILEKNGFEIVRIPTVNGELDRAALSSALEKPVFLASLMLVNNETGALYDVSDAFLEIKRKYPDAILHCDAVQGFLKVKFDPMSLGADCITVSGHKIHAPKGVGALWISDRMIKERKIAPVTIGGGQENGYRSGTENTIGISAFAAAANEGKRDFVANFAKMTELREYAIAKLGALDGVKLNLPAKAAPHVLSVTLPDIKSETMVHYLSSKGICVSSGSACSSHSNKTSGALLAFGLSKHAADCTIRVSFCRYNEKDEVDALADALTDGLKTLVRIK